MKQRQLFTGPYHTKTTFHWSIQNKNIFTGPNETKTTFYWSKWNKKQHFTGPYETNNILLVLMKPRTTFHWSIQNKDNFLMIHTKQRQLFTGAYETKNCTDNKSNMNVSPPHSWGHMLHPAVIFNKFSWVTAFWWNLDCLPFDLDLRWPCIGFDLHHWRLRIG